MMSYLASAGTAAAEKLPNWFVVTMGIGTVFVGLIAIILICLITGAIAGTSKKSKKTQKPAATGSAEDPRVRQEMLAAVCAACAEDMGTSPERLRVVSFRKTG